MYLSILGRGTVQRGSSGGTISAIGSGSAGDVHCSVVYKRADPDIIPPGNARRQRQPVPLAVQFTDENKSNDYGIRWKFPELIVLLGRQAIVLIADLSTLEGFGRCASLM